MMAQTSPANRAAAGRAVREYMKRSAHAEAGKPERDAIALLEQSSAGRVPASVPLRYGRMLASPFAFFRGSAILRAHDLGRLPGTGMVMPICGDAHLLNFGGFATPERQLVFDLNDFDEADEGPWEWDLKRLAVSFIGGAPPAPEPRHRRGDGRGRGAPVPRACAAMPNTARSNSGTTASPSSAC